MRHSSTIAGIWAAILGLTFDRWWGARAARTSGSARGARGDGADGIGASGARYRLHNGTFAISGNSTVTVSTDTDPAAGAIVLELRVGPYFALLEEGWSLQREVAGKPGEFETVEAMLTSMNPQLFEVLEHQVSLVRFAFMAAGEVVELSHGRAVITIDVTDTPVSDDDGDGVPAPRDCNDHNPGVTPGRRSSATASTTTATAPSTRAASAGKALPPAGCCPRWAARAARPATPSAAPMGPSTYVSHRDTCHPGANARRATTVRRPQTACRLAGR